MNTKTAAEVWRNIGMMGAYSPAMSNRPAVMNIEQVLGKKGLSFAIDSHGSRMFKNGKFADTNSVLADILCTDFRRKERLLSAIRWLLTLPHCRGNIFCTDIDLSRQETERHIEQLCRQGLIINYTPVREGYKDGYTVTVNPQAKDFINKEFAQLYLANYIRRNIQVDELYYNVTLKDVNTQKTYKIDLIYRTGRSVHFVLACLNPKLMDRPELLERLKVSADRLRSNVSIVTSPSIEPQMLRTIMRFNTASNTRDVSVIKLDQLQHLPR